MALVILVVWGTWAASLIWVWSQVVGRQQRPVTYWLGVVIVVMSPQLYFLAYGVVDWLRFDERCDALKVLSPEAVSTPLVWIGDMGSRGDALLHGALHQYLYLGVNFQPGGPGWVHRLKDECSLDTATTKRMECYQIHEVVVDELPEYGIVTSSQSLKDETTKWYSIFAVTYQLLKDEQVIGVWEEYRLSRSGINFLFGPNRLTCTSEGMSLRDWVRASVSTGD